MNRTAVRNAVYTAVSVGVRAGGRGLTASKSIGGRGVVDGELVLAPVAIGRLRISRRVEI